MKRGFHSTSPDERSLQKKAKKEVADVVEDRIADLFSPRASEETDSPRSLEMRPSTARQKTLLTSFGFTSAKSGEKAKPCASKAAKEPKRRLDRSPKPVPAVDAQTKKEANAAADAAQRNSAPPPVVAETDAGSGSLKRDRIQNNAAARSPVVSSRPRSPPQAPLFPKSAAASTIAALAASGSLFAQPLTKSLAQQDVADISSYAYTPVGADPSWLWGSSKFSGGSSSLRFRVMADVFDKVEKLKGSGQGSKKQSVVLLANLFRTFIYHCPKELYKAAYLCLNRVAPDYEGVETGVGDALIMKVLVELYGRTEAGLKAELATHEDLGRVAELSRCKTRTLVEPAPLTVTGVFDNFKKIAETSGTTSQQRKKELVTKVLVAAKGSEPKYLVRFLQQKMRVGMQAATVYQALANAFTLTKLASAPASDDGPPHEYVADIRRDRKKVSPAILSDSLVKMEEAMKTAFHQLPNLELIVKHLLNGADDQSLPSLCAATPGIPVHPMLAKPAKGFEEIAAKFENSLFTCEFKYDGERAQIHLLPGSREIQIFSRNLERLTQKYPDVVSLVAESFPSSTKDCIIDAEIVAYDRENDKILPFQVLSTRKRKDVVTSNIQIQVCIFAFDILRYNNESLLTKPLSQRRKFLRESIIVVPGKMEFARSCDTSDMEELKDFFYTAVEGNCEGLMVKLLEGETGSSYEPDKRSNNWMKLKKDYLETMSDSVDLVPIGAFFGKGRRAGVYGAFLLAVYDPELEVFQTVCKAGTGFNDEMLQQHFDTLKEKTAPCKKSYYEVDAKMVPEVWFEPCCVWECKAADLSLSPVHTAAYGKKQEGRGIGLRFPRFLRIREDKKPEQATTAQQIVEFYEAQFRNDPKVAEAVVDEEAISASDAEDAEEEVS